MPEISPLSTARTNRMLILQFAKETLTPAMGVNYGPATTTDAILRLADWILAADAEDVPEESENGEAVDSGFFARLLADLDRKRPTVEEIDALNIKFAETEQDTFNDFRTEVLHPFKASDVKAGFLTSTMRINEIVPDPVNPRNALLRGTSRHTGFTMALSFAPEDTVDTVCAACTIQNRANSTI